MFAIRSGWHILRHARLGEPECATQISPAWRVGSIIGCACGQRTYQIV